MAYIISVANLYFILKVDFLLYNFNKNSIELCIDGNKHGFVAHNVRDSMHI